MRVEKSFSRWRERRAERFGAILFDIDGTLVSGRRTLPGARALLAELRRTRFPFCLLTNDGDHSPEEKSALLAQRGLAVAADEIVSCGAALKPLADRRGYVGKTFFVMGRLGRPDFARRAGLRVVRDPAKISGCHGVIVGEGTYNWQANINAVANYFIERGPGGILLVPNPDSYWPADADGRIGIGAGAKARFLCAILREYGTPVRPVYLGKPYRPVYRVALTHLKRKYALPPNCAGRNILMLGDSLLSDIRGANRAGFSSGLLLTGITRPAHLTKAKGALRPHWIFAGL